MATCCADRFLEKMATCFADILLRKDGHLFCRHIIKKRWPHVLQISLEKKQIAYNIADLCCTFKFTITVNYTRIIYTV